MLSNCEPEDSGDVIREAVRNVKSRSAPLLNTLFSVSMAILSILLVSVTECAFRLCHLPFKINNVKHCL